MTSLDRSRSPRWHPSRRQLLESWCVGFGGVALAGLLHRQGLVRAQETATHPLAPRKPHFRPRAKRIIFLFMHGGPSHIDLFDPKPQLQRSDGQQPSFPRTRVTFAKRGNLLASPWKFRPVGKNGIPMSELWKHLPEVADELCMIHSLCDQNVAHGGACMKLSTGSDSLLRPSMGSWMSYGLGTENQNLPSFITICPTSLHGGVDNFGTAFLPSIHQGVPLGTPGYPNSLIKDASFEFLENRFRSPTAQRAQLTYLKQLNRRFLQTTGPNSDLEARIASFEMAFRMQQAAPEALDLSRESEATQSLYGIDDPQTRNFGQMCLLARRFAQRDVRFIQVSHAHSLPFNNEQWDQHSHIKRGHEINVGQIDKPITGLIKDLKQTGLLEDTLVLWGGEFGRTPTAQQGKLATIGRDHHPDGFTMWMAGAGTKGGYRYGKTDEFGYYAVEDRMTIHDLHATLLHAMGIDHQRLTYHYAGREFRLTDVHGQVADKLFV
ncbi:MAG: sulfatase [Planctomycetaceae bacterium]|nr:sulfatase [Planctomycetaceae bacterium]